MEALFIVGLVGLVVALFWFLLRKTENGALLLTRMIVAGILAAFCFIVGVVGIFLMLPYLNEMRSGALSGGFMSISLGCLFAWRAQRDLKNWEAIRKAEQETQIPTKTVYKCAMQFCSRDVEKPGMYCIYHQKLQKSTEVTIEKANKAEEKNMIKKLENHLKTDVISYPIIVLHKTFGRGVIRERLLGDKIFVQFADGKHMFVFPDCFERGYLTADAWGELTKKELVAPIKQQPTTKMVNSIIKKAPNISSAPAKNSTAIATSNAIVDPGRYKPWLNVSSGVKRALEKVEQEKGKVFRADTHAEFLNRVFGTNYKQWYKCVWSFAPDIEVWMVRFYKNTQEWRNRFLNEDKIKEEYIGYNPEDPRKYERPQYKIVVSIVDVDKDGYPRRYKIEGLFRFCRDESTSVRDNCRDPYFIHRRVVKNQGNYYTIYR